MYDIDILITTHSNNLFRRSSDPLTLMPYRIAERARFHLPLTEPAIDVPR